MPLHALPLAMFPNSEQTRLQSTAERSGAERLAPLLFEGAISSIVDPGNDALTSVLPGRVAANREARRGASPSLAGCVVPQPKARLSPKTTIRNAPVVIGRASATGVPIDRHHTPKRPPSSSASAIATPRRLVAEVISHIFPQ